MKAYNQIQMKTYEQLLPKFSNEQALEYVDKFVYPNNSIFRGQMKKIDEITRQKMISALSDNNSSKHSNGGGALQNRLSAKPDEAMGSHSAEGDGPRKSASEENFPNIVRHGYGV